MGARFRDSATFDAGHQALIDAVDAALVDIGIRNARWSSDATMVKASTGMNLWSWGENLTIYVDAAGNVDVQSQCSFPLQLIDWGKNRRNCNRLLDAVEQRLEYGDF